MLEKQREGKKMRLNKQDERAFQKFQKIYQIFLQ